MIGSWNGCGHAENHETEEPFPHWPKRRISELKEFLRSNGMYAWLNFFPHAVVYRV